MQISEGRHVLLEGKASDVPVRDEVFEAENRLGRMMGNYTLQWWCGLGVVSSEGNPICGNHLVYAYPPWPGNECSCKRMSHTYNPRAGEGYEQFISQALLRRRVLCLQGLLMGILEAKMATAGASESCQ